MSHELLFEIGVEELPAGYVPPALAQLESGARRMLEELRLSHGGISVLGTPRRLVLKISNLASRQKDYDEEAVGPAAKAAFDADGNPTKALLGFCRGRNVDVANVRRIDTPRGEYVAVTVHHEGRDAIELLPAPLATLATKLNFPKSMRWLDDDTRFARPVRWLVALLDEEVVPVNAFGLEAGRESFGHRFLAPEKVKIASANAYEDTMGEVRVIVDPEKRAATLRGQIETLASAESGRVVEDSELVEINNFLVECPTCFAGRFDAKYLDLPREVIVTALREHQKFFAVEDAKGALMPVFIAVRNGDERGLDGVRKGNEGVLIARLEDAKFYWETDLKHSPESQVDALSGVVWMENLGSLRDKAGRLEALTTWIAGMIAPEAADAAGRAAKLCKTDLLSEMIGSGKEYTSLEGVMGGYYARRAGEVQEVADAIAEHYRPRGPHDALPATPAGVVLSLADKLDHVAGAFVAGKTPSGSEDPYGVRRAANGVLRMLLEGGHRLDLRAASVESTKPFFTADIDLPHAEIMKKLGEFWRGRVDAALEDRDVAYDSRDAALEARVGIDARTQPGWIDPADALSRARVLSEFRSDARFEPLVILYKRVANILKASEEALPDAVDAGKLSEPAERELFKALEQARRRTAPLWEKRAYAEILPALLEMESAIHGFFDSVLVNAEDLAVRRNRLKLLAEIRELFVRGWDLSRVVVEGERVEAASR